MSRRMHHFADLITIHPGLSIAASIQEFAGFAVRTIAYQSVRTAHPAV